MRLAFALVLMTTVASAAVAQVSGVAPDPVPGLPGAGRPVDIEAFRARRAALMDRIGDGVIAVPAAKQRDLETVVLQDNDFRQDDYFFYLTGIETPNAWLLLLASSDGEDRAVLYLPPRDPNREQWTGRKLGPDDPAVRLIGIEDVRELDITGFGRDVEEALGRQSAPLFTVLWHGTKDNSVIQAWKHAGRHLRNVVPTIDSMRVVKDRVEIAALRRAIAITTEAHKSAMRAVHPGMYEYQLEATVEYTFRNLGADRLGFASIVGSGPNSTTLHYDVNRRRMQDGDLVVVDVGAEYAQYSADVTRTLPVNGRFSERQKAVYDLVLATQQAAIDAVRPGVTVRELSRIARSYMATNSGDLCGDKDCTRYFIHGLSHWIGMRVHDVGDYSMKLEPGAVLTVEPGIYIATENLGVRIEDDILVTDNGHEILSGGAPRTTDDIERLMHSSERTNQEGNY
ncbi:MAG: aminopeptidase P N-terminal domain-containing protein [Gemmatimonadales bacterium]